jgi:hypothetical protein
MLWIIRLEIFVRIVLGEDFEALFQSSTPFLELNLNIDGLGM